MNRMPRYCPVINFLFLPILLSGWQISTAQPLIRLAGIVVDARNGDALSYANVAVPGTDIGATTEEDGRFELLLEVRPDSLAASYVGYQPLQIALADAELENLRFELSPEAFELQEVTVRERRKRYRRKDNPALALIRQVIAHKDSNRLSVQPYYQYEKYEKVELDVSNLPRQLMESKALRSVDFIFDHMDTLENGKNILPFFLQESKSTVYYRRNPEDRKEYREALKVTNLDDYVTDASLYKLTQRLYQDVNVYENTIWLFDQKFTSPLGVVAPSFYRYYLLDTLEMKGRPVINLGFIPANKYDLGFEGNLFIAMDSTYRVLGVDMGILPYANLNFVKNLRIKQEFTGQDSLWVRRRDEVKVEYLISEKLMGLYGKKTTIYSDYRFIEPADPQVFEAVGQSIALPEESQRQPDYWEAERPEPLSSEEAAIYEMVDALKEVPLVKATATMTRLFSSGYFPAGPVYVGPIYSALSYNEVEGWRVRLGGKTNQRFHDQLHLRGYLAYGFDDRRLKYSGMLRYALEDRYRDFPRHFLSFLVERDNQFPGQFFQFVEGDNLFLSFRTGQANKMIAYQQYQLNYHREFPGNLFANFLVQHRSQAAAGAFSFELSDENTGATRSLNKITTAETGVVLQYAPNAELYESVHFRYPMPNRYPILELTYLGAWKGPLNGDYAFQALDLGVTKRFYMAAFGFTDAYLNVGKVWADGVPYVLLNIPNSNQSYAFLPRAYNLMNFMEFVTDEYAGFHLTHQFNGFLFNKIPLIRRFKWRAIGGVKILYGNLSEGNNPTRNPGLVQFPVSEEGVAETYALTNTPYMEWSVGVSNILKVFRIDYVKRMTYLHHPNLPRAFGMKGTGVKLGMELRF